MCMGLIVKPLLKKYVNMFECMEIPEPIYEGVVEPSYKKPTSSYTNRDNHSRKMRLEAASSNNYSETSKSDGKCRKMYIDHPKDRSKSILKLDLLSTLGTSPK